MRYRFAEAAIRDALEASPREFQVFVVLCLDADESGHVEFEQDGLGARLGCGRQTVNKCLWSLEDQGFLTKTTKYGGRGHPDMTAAKICEPILAVIESLVPATEPDDPTPAKVEPQPKGKAISQRRSRDSSEPANKK